MIQIVATSPQNEREAYRAMFAFGGTLAALDPTQVGNLPAAILNARMFAGEVIETLKANAPSKQAAKQHEQVA
jgi:chromosome partitioning protein